MEGAPTHARSRRILTLRQYFDRCTKDYLKVDGGFEKERSESVDCSVIYEGKKEEKIN